MALLEGIRALAIKVLSQFVGGLAMLLLAASLIAVYGYALGCSVW